MNPLRRFVQQSPLDGSSREIESRLKPILRDFESRNIAGPTTVSHYLNEIGERTACGDRWTPRLAAFLILLLGFPMEKRDWATFRSEREKSRKRSRARSRPDWPGKKPKGKRPTAKGGREKVKKQNTSLPPKTSKGAPGPSLGPAEQKQERASTVTVKDLEDKSRLALLLSKVGRVSGQWVGFYCFKLRRVPI